ncbi:hypothetical protein CLOBOL_06157 [Enterocloster bolteae ATCC BAA-613]|uniref:Uncharacterized protein n=1 Tax=Enterocloster bolteae (strain ATCC BAA-613 / DSM 15670 / CCUG 46953 / JCM 12243 / WAL 16351) TaxID=411902 RepID=A8S1T1_ENTBW|nr:hypothetical protein CLOBOL_06157 [Enterocloster bolteae ATCC BAA-613]
MYILSSIVLVFLFYLCINSMFANMYFLTRMPYGVILFSK